MAAVLAVLVLFSQATRLNQIKINGLSQLDAQHMQRVAAEGASKQWFGRNTLLISPGALSDYIKQAEPGVKQAQVKRSGLHSLSITVTERQPSLNWKSGDTVYLLDADGTVIGESKGAYVKLPTVIDGSNLPVKVGDRVAPQSFVAFASEFSRRAGEAGVAVAQMTVPETTSELMVKTNKGYVLKLDTTRTVSGELGDLKAVLAELAKSRKTPSEYIDLRIEHKAYYK